MKHAFNHEVHGSTPRAILEAAGRVLGRDGFAALTARNIAAEAGTNLALLNYHFGSKELLLLEIFDYVDAQRLERQRGMYEAPGEPLSAKWRRAVAYYRQDLADGYVRILQELTAHGYSNPAIAERVRGRMRAWRGVLEAVAAVELPRLGVDVPPAWVVSALASFWWGMETQHLVGATEEEGRFFEVLDAVGDWLEQREREARDGRTDGRNARTKMTRASRRGNDDAGAAP